MTKWIAEFDLEDGDTMPEHMDLEYDGAKIDYHCRPMWIPCSERLPEPPSYCLVTTDGSHNDVIDIALYMSDGWHKASEVIAWMPLQEPYKGVEHE